jgi:hypothetical protein
MLAAAVVVAVATATATTLSDAARVRIASDIDGHWRGAYDILVRPAGAASAYTVTSGLVERDFLGFAGHGGITVDQLQAIRAIDGVEVAAPLAFVGSVSATSSAPAIHLDRLPKGPTLYRVRLTVTVNDGRGDRTISSSEGRVLVGIGVDGLPLATSDYKQETVGTSAKPAETTVDVSTRTVIPPVASQLLAIDPIAEKQLLGSAGSFLDPLLPFRGKSFTAATADPAMVIANYDARGRIAILNRLGGAAMDRPVFPVLVSSRVYTSIRIRLDVEQLGRPITGLTANSTSIDDLDAMEARAGTGVTNFGSSSVDLSEALRALRVNPISVPWPGSSPSPGAVFFRQPPRFETNLAQRPQYVPKVAAPSGGIGFQIQPLGPVDPGGNPVGSPVPGEEQSFRPIEHVLLSITDAYQAVSDADQPFVLAPVGEYDLGAVHLPTDPLAYVPFGAYDPPSATLVANPAGESVNPVALQPTLSQAGLIAGPPLAITDIATAVALRGSHAIDAIRVRVSDLNGFNEVSRARVEGIASQIAALGLDVQVVAGSSPTDVSVYVPAYDLDGPQPRDLGWVSEPWTTLGAAVQVERGLSETDIRLLELVVAALLTGIVGLGVVESSTRRPELATLREIGWSRASRAAWLVGESGAAGLIIALVGLGAAAIGTGVRASIVVAITGAIAFPVVTVLASLSAGRPNHSGGPFLAWILRRLPAAGALGVALHRVAWSPGRFAIMAVSIAGGSTSLGIGFSLVSTLGSRTGGSNLAVAVGANVEYARIGLMALCAIGLIAMALALISLDERANAGDRLALRAVGWPARRVGAISSWIRVVVAIPAALTAFVLVRVLAPATIGTAGSEWDALAAAVALSFVVWGGAGSTFRRPRVRR